MLSGGAITADALIEEVLDERAASARLANGHRFVACVPSHARRLGAGPVAGEWVRVRFSPCDLSRGWIIQEGRVKR